MARFSIPCLAALLLLGLSGSARAAARRGVELPGLPVPAAVPAGAAALPRSQALAPAPGAATQPLSAPAPTGTAQGPETPAAAATLAELGARTADQPGAAAGHQDEVAAELDRAFEGARGMAGRLSGISVLPPEQERELALRKASGDHQAANKLVTHNLRFAYKIAMEYRGYGYKMNDLLQEASLGLMKGVEKYDPGRGYKLSTYAAWWIRAFVLRYIMDNWKLGKAGTNAAQRSLFFKLRHYQELIEKEHGASQAQDPAFVAAYVNEQKAKAAEASPEEAAAEEEDPGEGKKKAKKTSTTPDDVRRMMVMLGNPVSSLDAPINEDGRPTAWVDQTPSKALPQDEFLIAQRRESDLKRAMAEAVEFIGRDNPIREAILRKRLLAEKPMTLKEIGDEFGLSRERIRQIELNVKQRLKAELQRRLAGTDVLEDDAN